MFLGGVAGRAGTQGWFPGPHPYSAQGNLGSTRNIGGGGRIPAPSPADVPITRGGGLTAEELTSIYMRQPVRGLERSELELLQYELEQRLRTNPADDFARLMLQDVKKRRGGKVKGRVRRAAARKVLRKLAPKLLRMVPGLGLLAGVYDAASTAAEVVEAVQLASMERALGPSTMAGYRGRQATGPRTRTSGRRSGRPAVRAQPVPLPVPAPVAHPRPAPLPDAGALRVPEPSPVIELSPNPLTQAAPGPKPKPKRARATPSSPSSRTRTRTPSLQDMLDRLGLSPGSQTGVRTDPGSRTAPKPLTGAERSGGNSDCRCKTEKRKRKPKKPRELCRKGSYVETAKGLIKHPREEVPCQ